MEYNKKDVQLSISYTHNDKAVADELLSMLLTKMKLSRKYNYEIFGDDMLLGDNWHHEIKLHLGNCDVILLLLSEEYLASQYITEHEVPFLMKNSKCLPIEIKNINFQLLDSTFSMKQIFSFNGLSFDRCNYHQKQDFCEELFMQIQIKLDSRIDILERDDAIKLWLEGKEQWNNWANSHEGWMVDFSETDFSKYRTSSNPNINFTDYIFPGKASFISATFGHGNVYFNYTNFSNGSTLFKNSSFMGGTISYTNAIISENGIDFSYTSFGANCVIDFNDLNLTSAKIINTNLTNAKLKNTILINADISGTMFSSQTALRDVIGITQDQLESAIFLDEINSRKRRTNKTSPSLRITLKGDFYLSPKNQARLFIQIQSTYNMIFYLLTTKDNTRREIDKAFDGSNFLTLINAQDDIIIDSITTGSLDILITTLKELCEKSNIKPSAITAFIVISTVLTISTNAIKTHAEATKIYAEATKIRHETDILEIEKEIKAIDLIEKKKAQHIPILSKNTSLDSSKLFIDHLLNNDKEIHEIILDTLDKKGIIFTNPIIDDNKCEYLTRAITPLATTLDYFNGFGMKECVFKVENTK